MSLKDFFTSKRAAAGDSAGAAPAGGAAAASGAAATPAANSGGASAGTQANTSANANSGTGAASQSAAPPSSPLSGFTDQMKAAPAGGSTDALNSQIVQAVQMSNSETAAYASSQIAIAPNMMITQAGGLVAQSAANYFDGASKLALASKSVLLKNMTEKLVKEDIKGAAEDALGVLITDLLVGTAAAVAAAAGAIEGEAAHFALDKIDQSLNKYQTLLDRKSKEA
ncbi:hypothetical protein FAZ69_22215 [Trinickia terrae]|uniref:Uncharacterized protein n=1 Tax=Trinickia terrae TaxID=2571161 RepID=A0A4U1HWK1_9BURK|nr:hypothetical protein [Trinickia terrae]TKC86021.1 hypothetical protein FAZ69_22215 [Trinickia terrae]